jgi:hypothetical protein
LTSHKLLISIYGQYVITNGIKPTNVIAASIVVALRDLILGKVRFQLINEKIYMETNNIL